MQLDDGRWTFRYDKALRSGPPRPRQDPAAAWSLLEKIRAPTLLLRGAESDVLDRETAEHMTRVIPDCRLVEVPDAGHSIPLDNPTGFREAVATFLT
jgi:pimeloyl-ACP methyl ester carboxylesterase